MRHSHNLKVQEYRKIVEVNGKLLASMKSRERELLANLKVVAAAAK